ncbi:MAG: hypothetical protein ABIQ76_08960, partial [Candidatus Limnocylindrales bacterium]
MLGSAVGAAPAAAQTGVPVTAGYRDQTYGDPAAPGADDVTAARNQSKLWFSDGTWWALLFDRKAPNLTAKFRIYRFDMATQGWTSTGVAADDRNRSHADVLSDGNTLYIASAQAAGTSVAKDVRIYKYTYSPATKAYTLVAGFPKLLANTSAGTGYSTITRDSTGTLWVAFTQSNKVMISRSTDAGVTWATPIALPGMGNDITAEDVAAI